MNRLSMSFRRSLLLGIMAFVLSTEANASLFRAGFTLGNWMGNFQQSSSGRFTSIDINPAIGIEAQVGVSLLNIAFIEWAPSWFWVQKWADSSNKTGDASYLGLLAVNVGGTIPLFILNLEPYVGVENGNYAFSTGVSTGYWGLAGKVGLGVKISALPIRLNFEFRRHFLNSDGGGTLPMGSSTTLSTYFMGVGIGLF